MELLPPDQTQSRDQTITHDELVPNLGEIKTIADLKKENEENSTINEI